MKNLYRIINEVVSEVRESIVESLRSREYKTEVERYYGEASIVVEIGCEVVNGWLMPYKRATVVHCEEHKSPLLEEAIMNALPDWDEVENEFNEVQGEYEAQREYEELNR